MRAGCVAILAGTLLASGAAAAGGIERVPPLGDTATAEECGECHMAFQPALLPAESWMRIMDGLNDHFGDDASLPADVTAHIRAHLTAHAGRIGDARIVRITEQPWFVREHRFHPSVWKRPEIGVRNNCPACHPRAEQGKYDDD